VIVRLFFSQPCFEHKTKFPHVKFSLFTVRSIRFEGTPNLSIVGDLDSGCSIEALILESCFRDFP
jgi:hypothetical protein